MDSRKIQTFYLPFFPSISEPRNVLDLVFVIDGSDSLKEDQFDQLKETVKQMLKDHTISPLDTHVSILEYSEEPTVFVYLNDTFDSEELNAKIDRIIASNGRTAILHKALMEVSNVFDVKNGGRPGAAKAVVILTDGDASDSSDLDTASKLLRGSGTRVYVVKIGDDKVPDEIIKIVSTPEDVFPVVDPTDLPSVGPNIGEKIKTDIEKGKIY